MNGHQEEIWFDSANSKRFGQLWLPAGEELDGLICVVHGLGEHSGRYADFAETMKQWNCGTFVFDLIGHGRSPGWRGCIDSFDGLMTDIGAALALLYQRFPAARVVLYGHSMGGNLVLNYALREYEPRPQAVIASGSFLRPKQPLSKAYLLFARTIAKVLPHYRLVAPVRAEGLSRDRSEQEAYRRDDLVHCKLSLQLGAAILDAGQWAISHASELSVPALVMHGSADELTCPDASREFAEQSNSHCSLRIFEGFYHDIHRDVGRNEVFNCIHAWMAQWKAKP